MARIISATSAYENLEEGRYLGVCYKIIDQGTILESFQGGAPAPKLKVRIGFEIIDTLDLDGAPTGENIRMADGRPFVIDYQYTNSLNEKARLCKDLVSWRGRNFTPEEQEGFDMANLFGKSVNIEVGLTSGGNPKITGLFKPNGGVQSMDTINEITDFELETYLDEFRDKSSDASKKMCDIWEGMTAWMQDEIKTSLEYVDVMRKFDEKPNGVEGLAAIANKRPNEKVVNKDDENFIDDDIPF